MKRVIRKLKILCSLAIIPIIGITAGSYKVYADGGNKDLVENSCSVDFCSSKNLLKEVSTDKSLYKPNDDIEIDVKLENNLEKDISDGTLELDIKHFDQKIGNPITQKISINKGESKDITFSIKAPDKDFTGYLAEIYVKGSDEKVIEKSSTAIDVSSTWTKFPRYGYLSDFADDVDTEDVINQLAKYHINGLQYYDWQYKHHNPVSKDEDSVSDKWQNISNTDIYKSTVDDYISNGHKKGMMSMEYNLIYGATQDYDTDGTGVKKEWGLYKQNGGTDSEQWKITMPDGWQTDAIYFMDPSNKDWQDYIFSKEQDVFDNFDFDGWHMDTVGDCGTVYKADGTPVSITKTFNEFLNSAKEKFPDKYIIMNAVGNKGHKEVNTSNVDDIYSEIWEGDGIPTYNALRNVIDEARIESSGKSLIVPAYMNYNLAKNHTEDDPAQFNVPSVLLTGASVFAAGGSRLELGDDTRMLCQEYFPNKNVVMTDELKEKERKYYDFIVAYENLLRDGQVESDNAVETDKFATSTDGEADKIWAYSKKDDNYDIVQMINLLGITNLSWRDANGLKNEPNEADNFKVKYYTDDSIESVCFASPDYNDCMSNKLDFSKGKDSKGNYIEFTVPSLKYWNMIYLKKGNSENSALTDNIGTKGKLNNCGFEDGVTAWKQTGNYFGVDSNDVYSGERKAYFYSNNAYSQKIEQNVDNLKNGVYNVSAMVKQNTGTADYAAMELTSGNNKECVNIKPSKDYQKIQGKINVVDGKLNVAFNYKASSEANLQIDDIKLIDADGNVISKEGNVIKDDKIPESSKKVTNGDFETGNTANWNVLNPDGAGVDRNDVYSNKYKCYFWGKGKQSIKQKIVDLENGKYKVTANVKQNTGDPSTCELQLSDFGAKTVSQDIKKSDEYKEVSAQADVKNNSLTISFNEESDKEANLQIDNVNLIKM